MIKDDAKNGRLREMIYKFWYRKYFDPGYEHSDMVLFINSVLLVIPFKKPRNYWERIIKSPGSVEALCDRLIRAADRYRCLEDKVISIIDDVTRGDRLRILPMSVAHKRRVLCNQCFLCENCKRGRNRERNESWLCDECNARKTLFDTIGKFQYVADFANPGEYIVVEFNGNYEACCRCGGLVY